MPARTTASGAALAILSLLAGSLPAGTALAQEAPPAMRPTRDVTVTYRMGNPSGGAPQELRWEWAPSAGKLRVSPPGNEEWMLVDLGAGTAVMVTDAERQVATLPPQAAAAMIGGPPPGAQFARRGADRVAGQPCTEWEVTIPRGRSTLCITADGLLLRAVTPAPSNGARLEATEVRYGPQDPARFRVPPGYQAVQGPPGGMPGR